MYSDDDLQDETNALFRCKSQPYLHVFDDEEESCRRVCAAAFHWTGIDGYGPYATELTKAIDKLRVWRIERFFATVQGIYKDDLDLSGRHPHRLSEVESRWNEYVKNFVDLCRHVTRRTEDTNFSGNITTLTEYIFDDESVWERFKKTWKLPAGIEFEFLVYRTINTLEVQLANPSYVPKPQKLCLVDLPLELLHMIFRHAQMSDARMLSSTCRLLHTIGHPRLASNQKIVLKLPRIFYTGYHASRSDPLPGDCVANAALAARSNAIAICDFLQSRQDLLNQIRHLYVDDQWTDGFGESLIAAHPHVTLEDRQFYAPLYKSISRILFSSPNLTSMDLGNVMLPLDLIVSICSSLKLECLLLQSCNLATEAQHALEADSQGTYSSTVRHLEILTTSRNDTSWYAMLFFPKLVSLVVRPLSLSGFILHPQESIWPRCRFFPTLKYLLLVHLSLSHFTNFSHWIHQGSHEHIPRLTHLKIEVERGISDSQIRSLLETFRSAPLEVLSIEGALQADLPLFDWIAQHFSNLLGLTIMRRNGTRQSHTTSIAWPLPSWQYAQCLSAFSRLQYFGWNNFVCSLNFAPSSLKRLEDEGSNAIDYDAWDEADEDHFLFWDIWTPVLFGIHCPTLHSFSLRVIHYSISRPSEGVVQAKSQAPGTLDDEWDPNAFFGYWLLTPSSAEYLYY